MGEFSLQSFEYFLFYVQILMPNFTSIALYKGRQNIPCIHLYICFIDIMANKSYLLTRFSASRFVRYFFRREKNGRTNK